MYIHTNAKLIRSSAIDLCDCTLVFSTLEMNDCLVSVWGCPCTGIPFDDFRFSSFAHLHNRFNLMQPWNKPCACKNHFPCRRRAQAHCNRCSVLKWDMRFTTTFMQFNLNFSPSQSTRLSTLILREWKCEDKNVIIIYTRVIDTIFIDFHGQFEYI